MESTLTTRIEHLLISTIVFCVKLVHFNGVLPSAGGLQLGVQPFHVPSVDPEQLHARTAPTGTPRITSYSGL